MPPKTHICGLYKEGVDYYLINLQHPTEKNLNYQKTFERYRQEGDAIYDFGIEQS